MLADLEAYRDLVKSGGVLWGDDYATGTSHFPGVRDAVNCFVEKYGYSLEVYGYNWIIIFT